MFPEGQLYPLGQLPLVGQLSCYLYLLSSLACFSNPQVYYGIFLLVRIVLLLVHVRYILVGHMFVLSLLVQVRQLYRQCFHPCSCFGLGLAKVLSRLCSWMCPCRMVLQLLSESSLVYQVTTQYMFVCLPLTICAVPSIYPFHSRREHLIIAASLIRCLYIGYYVLSLYR